MSSHELGKAKIKGAPFIDGRFKRILKVKMAEIIAVGLWLTVGEVGEGVGGTAVPNDVHPQVESHEVLGGKVDSGHLEFQKVINSNEIILWLAVHKELLFDRD